MGCIFAASAMAQAQSSVPSLSFKSDAPPSAPVPSVAVPASADKALNIQVASPVVSSPATATAINVQGGAVDAHLAKTSVQPPADGNAYEKEITPLLRDISRAKAQLELKKLQAEIQKADADIAEAKNGGKSSSIGGRSANFNTPAPINTGPRVFTPGEAVGGSAMPVSPISLPQVKEVAPPSDIKVLMILGYQDDLAAKISTGSQGGYVIKKGDILPGGQKVVDITDNYIEIQKPNTAKAVVSKSKVVKGKKVIEKKEPVVKTEKIYVSEGDGVSAPKMTGAGARPFGPMSLPGMQPR